MTMKRIIAVTGTPGTGKTTISERLLKSLKNAELIRANDIVRERKLFTARDRHGSLIVKMKGLESELNRRVRASKADFVIVEGHLLCDIRIRGAVAVVVREHPATLLKRLRSRGYPRQKIEDNIVSEAIDYCGVNAASRYRKVYEVESGEAALGRIIDIARGRKVKPRDIEMLGELNGVLAMLR